MTGILQGVVASLGGAPALKNFGVVMGSPSPFIYAWEWDNSTGWGTKYADPASPPYTGSNGNMADIDISPDGSAIAFGVYISPWAGVYAWSGSGFGAKFTNPSPFVSSLVTGVKFSPDGTALAIARVNSPYVNVYAWSSSGFGAKFSDPASLPAGDPNSVTFAPNGSAIALGLTSSPYVNVYPWSGSGFGAKFSNPATLPPTGGTRVQFSANSDFLIVGTASNSPSSINAYPWSGSGFGTIISSPASGPTAGINGISFNPNNDAVAFCQGSTPSAFVYPWTGSSFGTRYTNPTSPHSITVTSSCTFSPDGGAIAYIGIDPTNGPVQTWAWNSSTGFGARYNNPSGSTGGNLSAQKLVWHFV